jgi:hypothetical protein
MKVAAAQFDLFDEAPGYREVPRPAARARKQPSLVSATWDADAAVMRLEESGDFKILRRLVPRPVIPRDQSRLPNLGVIVDTETTGLHHARVVAGRDGVDDHVEAVIEALQISRCVHVHITNGAEIEGVLPLVLGDIENSDLGAQRHGKLQGHVAKPAEACYADPVATLDVKEADRRVGGYPGTYQRATRAISASAGI